MENDNRDMSSRQILLMFDALIYGEQDIKLCSLRGCAELSVLETGQPSKARRLAIVIGKVLPHPFINAFIYQNAHQE